MLTVADAERGALFAQGKLDARYTVTLAGLPIGRGAWVIDIGEDLFHRVGERGDLRLAAGLRQRPRTERIARKRLGGQLVASRYASHIVTDQKSDEVRMVISSGTVKEFVVDPPTVSGRIVFPSPRLIGAA